MLLLLNVFFKNLAFLLEDELLWAGTSALYILCDAHSNGTHSFILVQLVLSKFC